MLLETENWKLETENWFRQIDRVPYLMKLPFLVFLLLVVLIFYFCRIVAEFFMALFSSA